MDRRNTPNSPTDRANRRGCFIIAAVLLLLIAAIAFVGFSGDAIDDLKSTIPVLGGLLVGLSSGRRLRPRPKKKLTNLTVPRLFCGDAAGPNV